MEDKTNCLLGRPIEGDRLLPKPEAAHYCGLSESCLTNQIAEGRGPRALRVSPRRFYFRRSDLEHWMASWVRD